jgi:hypothetical protein
MVRRRGQKSMIRRMSRKYRWVRKDSLSVVGVDVVDVGGF